MYQRRSRRYCAWMLVLSVCLRLCMALGLDAKAAAALSEAARDREVARFLLFLETGQAVRVAEPERETRVAVLKIHEPRTMAGAPEEDAPIQTEPETTALPKLAAAEQITVGGGCTYSFDKAALLMQPSTLHLAEDGPTVLIVHTHSTEAYTQENGWEYEAITSYRTLDAARSVIAVGQALAQTLEAAGIGTIHDTAVNDYPSYNDSYRTTLTRIERWLEQYPSIQMVIDVHRDAVEDASGNAVALSSVQEGQQAARLMLVVGTDQGGLPHPDWQENLANALKLQAVLEGQWPGLCRQIDLRTERFNQHATAGSVLVEVGSNGNTLAQALCAARLLGQGLAAMLRTVDRTGGTLIASP